MHVQQGSKPLLWVYRTVPYGVQIKFISVLRVRIRFSANPYPGNALSRIQKLFIFLMKKIALYLSLALHEEHLSYVQEKHTCLKREHSAFEKTHYITITCLWLFLPNWIRMRKSMRIHADPDPQNQVCFIANGHSRHGQTHEATGPSTCTCRQTEKERS